MRSLWTHNEKQGSPCLGSFCVCYCTFETPKNSLVNPEGNYIAQDLSKIQIMKPNPRVFLKFQSEA
jgi:hypothetical protein